MKRVHFLGIIALSLVFLGTSCQGGGITTGKSTCEKGTCVGLDVAPTTKLEDATTITVTVTSETDDAQLRTHLEFSAPDIQVDGMRTWQRPITSKQPLTLSTRIKFPSEGYFQIVAWVETKNHDQIGHDVWVHATKGGITPNPPPERGPGTPAPAQRLAVTPSSVTKTPAPVPPTRPAYP